MNIDRARRFLMCFLVFAAGFVVCGNLTRLLETSSNYEASWGNVAFASFLGIFFSVGAVGGKD